MMFRRCVIVVILLAGRGGEAVFSPHDQKYLLVLSVLWAYVAGNVGWLSSCSDGESWLALLDACSCGLGSAACGLRIPLGVYCNEALLPVQDGGTGGSRPLSLALSLKGSSLSRPILLSSCSPECDPQPFPDSCPPSGVVTGSVPSLISWKSVWDLRHQTCYFPALS